MPMVRGVRGFVAVLLMVVAALSACDVLSYGQNVTVKVISPAKPGAPNDFITHTFVISNPGAATTFDLKLDLSDGLMSIGLQKSLSMAAGEMLPVFVTVVVTTAALAAANEVTLTATSQVDPANKDSATAIINIIEVAEVRVMQPEMLRVQAGTQTELKFLVLNLGNSPNEFRVLVSSEAQIGLTVAPQELSLLAGESAEVVVTVSIPVDILTQLVNVVVRVDSTIFPGVQAEVKAPIEILPPSASTFSTNLNLDIPVLLQGAIDPVLGTSTRVVPLAATIDLVLPRGPRLVWTLRERDIADLAPVFALSFQFSELAFFLTSSGRFTGTLELEPFFFAATADENDLTLRGRLASRIGQSRIGAGFTVSQILGSTTLTSGTVSQTTASVGFPLGPINMSARFTHDGPAVFLQTPEQTSLSLSMSSSEPNLSSVLNLEISLQNLSQDPLFSTITDVSSNLDVRVSPGNNLPVLNFGTKAEGSEGQGAAATFSINNKNTTLFFDAKQRVLSLFDLEFFADHSLLVNDATKTSFTVDRSFLTVDVDVDVLTFGLELGRIRTKDNTLNAITDGENSLGASVGVFINTLSLGLRLSRIEEVTLNDVIEALSYKLSASAAFLINGFSFTTNASILFEDDKGLLDANLSFEFSQMFTIPTPIPAKGQVEGFVFIDLNENGKRDGDEPGVPDTIVTVGNFKVLSDTEIPGFYRSPPLDPAEYEIQLESLLATIIPGIELPLTISLIEGQRLTVDIPLLPIGSIEGTVFNDLNRDGQQDVNEPGLAGVAVLISGSKIEPLRLRTDAGGRYNFTNLPAGDYVVVLDENTLATRFVLTTPGEVAINLSAGELRILVFGAFQQPQQILFAPSADFSFAPARPKVGEAVTFDASASLDFDGEIVGYEWDFDDDGIKDAKGKVVTHVFEKSGQFLVTLTAIDNDGKIGVKGPVPVEVDD